MIFPVSGGAIQLTTAVPTSVDQFSNGIRVKSDGSKAFASLSGGDKAQNGFLLDANGAIIYVDATAGIPANTQVTNGYPISPDGAICISTGSVDEWQNGIPFATNGAVCAVVTP